MIIFKRRCLVTGGFGPAKQVFAGDFPADFDTGGGSVSDHAVAITCEGGHNEMVIGLTIDEARELRTFLSKLPYLD